MRKLVYIFLFSVLILGCDDGKVQQELSSKHGGNLRINESYTLKVVNPQFTNNISASHVFAQVFEGLVKFNTKNMEVIPSIAKSWTVNEDNTLYSFNLRTNVFFHSDKCFSNESGVSPDTRKVNARDVKYSLEKYCQYHPLNKHSQTLLELIAGAKEYYEGEESGGVKSIEGIKVLNDSTIEIRLLSPSSFFLKLIANPAIVIIPEEACEMYGDESRIGTGPFLLPEVTQNKQVLKLVRNTNYYLKDKKGYPLPYLDTIVFSFIGSTKKELSLFENDELDVVLSLPKKYVNQFLEENVQFFESKPPRFVLHQSKDSDDLEIYNLINAKVKGFYTNSMNYLDFTAVYFQQPKMVE